MRYTKGLIVATLLLVASTATAQWRWSPYHWQYYGVKPDSLLVLPKILANPSLLEAGAIRWNTNTLTTQVYDGSVWADVGVASSPTLQIVTDNGSSTSNNILANGGIDVSSGNLLLGRGPGTERIRTNRFIDLYGNSPGVDNGALVSFFKSNGLRTGAIGDGSSFNDRMVIATNNTADLSFTTSNGNTASDPYLIPLTITNYSDGGKVLVGDSASNVNTYSYNKLSVNGQMQVYNTDNKSSQIEFWDGRTSGGGKLRVSMGMLGQPEANMSCNMDYTTRVHKYYDSTQNAIWTAITPIRGAFAVQYAPKGLPHTSSPDYDIWYASGARYNFWADTAKAFVPDRFGAGTSSPQERIHANGKVRADSGLVIYTLAHTWNVDFRRTGFAQGLGINHAGGIVELNSYDSSNAVYSDYSFKSTKGSTTKVVTYVDGDSGNMGVGPSTSPTARVDINGSTGYNQLRLRTAYTPTSSADANGSTGDVSWDDNYIYIKTSAGWKRSALTIF